MQQPPFYAFIVVACLPFALHVTAMLGNNLLSPVRSGFERFDRFYNRVPWLPSILCGVFGCIALATKAWPGAFYASLTAVGLLALIDFIGAMFSYHAWARKRR